MQTTVTVEMLKNAITLTKEKLIARAAAADGNGYTADVQMARMIEWSFDELANALWLQASESVV